MDNLPTTRPGETPCARARELDSLYLTGNARGGNQETLVLRSEPKLNDSRRKALPLPTEPLPPKQQAEILTAAWTDHPRSAPAPAPAAPAVGGGGLGTMFESTVKPALSANSRTSSNCCRVARMTISLSATNVLACLRVMYLFLLLLMCLLLLVFRVVVFAFGFV